jgi:spermidine synthase
MNPDGVITQWVPLYESNHAAVKCELATLLDIFPESVLFSGQSRRSGYDLVVVGRCSEREPDVSRMVQKLVQSPWGLRQSLAQIELFEPRKLEETFVATGRELTEWLADAERNLDRNLRLQYLAGITPDAHTENTILRDIAVARTLAVNRQRVFSH